MSDREFTFLICAEVLPTSLLLLGFWAWSRWQRREGLAKGVTRGKQAAHMPVALAGEHLKLTHYRCSVSTGFRLIDSPVASRA
jgi:hypothetical protein